MLCQEGLPFPSCTHIAHLSSLSLFRSGSVMHVGVLSIQFNKKSIDRVFVAGMRFIAGSSQLLEKNV